MSFLAVPFFFFNDTATTAIYTLSLHDALPISLLLVQDGGGPAVRLDDARGHARHRPDAVVLVLLDLLREVVIPGLNPGEPHRDVGHRDEEDLVHERGPPAGVAVRRFRPSRVVLEARQPDMAVRLVLDEAEGARADDLIRLPVGGRVAALLRVDRGAVVRTRERDEEHARRRLHVDGD